MCKNSEYRLDDLQINNLKLYQNPKWFCFGMDSVLLANFAANYVKKNSFVFDLCTGSGVVAILLQEKAQVKKIIGVEALENICDMARESIKYNNLCEKIEILNCNINDIEKSYYDKVDCITVNPPYMKENSSLKNENEYLKIARHEILCTLSDIINISSKLLKTGGKFFMVHQTNRIDEIIRLLYDNNMSVKEIKFIYPFEGKNSNLCLIYAAKSKGGYVKVLPPLVIYDSSGEYTCEALKYYGGMKPCAK